MGSNFAVGAPEGKVGKTSHRYNCRSSNGP